MIRKIMWETLMKEICDHKNKVILKNVICDADEIYGMTQRK